MEILKLQDVGVAVAVSKAAEILRRGGIVLYPTDTVYGLAVDATNPGALALLRELKGREKKKPISVIVPDLLTMGQYAVMNPAAQHLAMRFLPGALTLVMRATPAIPAELQLNGAIGIRIPNDPFCLALAKAFGKPYTATSANKSGRETAATLRDILAQFGHTVNDIALAIDDGDRRGNKPSTVVTTVDGVPYVLREGAIPREEILA